MGSENLPKFILQIWKDSPALAYGLYCKTVVSIHPTVVLNILIGLYFINYFSALTFLEIATKGNWKEMRLYAAYTIVVIARATPWIHYISLALDNLKMLNNLVGSLSRIHPKTNKYIKRVIHEHHIFQLISVYMVSVTCFAQLMRIISVESEKEYNYAMKYMHENFGSWDTPGVIMYIIVDSIFTTYTLFVVIGFAAQANGTALRFIDIFENMEAINRTSAITQHSVNTILKYAAKQHSEILRLGRQINETISFHMVHLSLNGVITITSCLYIFLTTKTGHLSIGSVIFVWISTAMLLCHCGQKITNSSTEYYDFLNNLPWYNWNEQNKKIYLIMLMNSTKDMACSCYGVRIINYAYLQDVFRSIYSLACVGCKLQ